MAHFEFKGYDFAASPEEVRNAIFRLRYQVYCLEWGFEKVEDHPSGLETDPFDPHAVHISARVDGAQETDIIGTSRIILGREVEKFPIAHHCQFFHDFKPPKIDKSGEISRLAVSKQYRRRAVDQMIFAHGEVAEATMNEVCGDGTERRQSENEIVAGIYMQLYAESKRLEITHWYAVMARGLYLLLRRWGVIFHPIGPELNYHGWRGPYMAEIAEIEKFLDRKKSPLIEGARKVLAEMTS